jgi:transcriptional regulator with XRE-family HTH domain
MNKEKFGKLIKKLRNAKGLTLEDLAKTVGVSIVNISHIENGRSGASRKVLQKLAKALDYDVDKLLAAADEIGEDVERIIRKIPSAVPDFLRTAKNLTKDEWENLTEQIKEMNNKKDDENGK